MKKCKSREAIMVNPQTPTDLEDIVSILQEREVSVLVNMSKCKISQKALGLVMDYILAGTKSYIAINIKKIFPKVFICYSKRKRV